MLYYIAIHMVVMYRIVTYVAITYHIATYITTFCSCVDNELDVYLQHPYSRYTFDIEYISNAYI